MRADLSLVAIGTALIPILTIALPLRAQSGAEPAGVRTQIVTQEEKLLDLYRREREKGTEGLYRYANELRASGLLLRSLDLYENFLVLYPDHPRAFDATIDIAETYRKLNRFREAGRIFEKAYAIYPEQERGLIAYLNAARIYSDLGEREKAERILNDIIARRPFSPVSRMARADLVLMDSTRGIVSAPVVSAGETTPLVGQGVPIPVPSPAETGGVAQEALDRMGEGVEQPEEK
jgi:tetratricopeptide (TPR) repeat protein